MSNKSPPAPGLILVPPIQSSESSTKPRRHHSRSTGSTGVRTKPSFGRYKKSSLISANDSGRHSIGDRIITANEAVNGNESSNLLGIGLAIFLTLATVHSLSYVTVEYGMYNNRNTYSEYTREQTCLSELKMANFDIYETSKYSKFMDESTTFSVTETGTWVGPADIKEYVDFVLSDLFNIHDTANDKDFRLISATDDTCHVLSNSMTKIRNSLEYSTEGTCALAQVAYSMHYSANNGFKVDSITVFYPKPALELLFGILFDTDEVRDDICATLENNCQETFKFNNLTMDTCLSKYESLPALGDDSYLDGNSKGCRVIHSRFAKLNPNHCPHLSFEPQEDLLGNIKCQKSKGQQLSDFFSQYELDLIEQKAYEWGFDETMVKPCEYKDVTRNLPKPSKNLNMKDSHPTYSMLNDYQFQVYVGFIMWATMVLAGLGMEFLVWRIMLNGEWDKDKENRWKVAQFVFPLLAATSLGLAATGNYLAMPIAVITFWKLGFPETIMFYFMALNEERRSWQERAIDFTNGMGTIVHHSSSAMYIAMLITHVLPANRYTIGSTLPLVMQHWIVLVKYDYKLVYIILETIIEIWWEWTAFSVLETVHEYHWVGGMSILSMLFAHWCYFGAGLFALFVVKIPVDEEDQENAVSRFSISGSNGFDRLTAVNGGDEFERFNTLAQRNTLTQRNTLAQRRCSPVMGDGSPQAPVEQSQPVGQMALSVQRPLQLAREQFSSKFHAGEDGNGENGIDELRDSASNTNEDYEQFLHTLNDSFKDNPVLANLYNVAKQHFVVKVLHGSVEVLE